MLIFPPFSIGWVSQRETHLGLLKAPELSHARDYLQGAGKAKSYLHKPHGSGLSVADGTVYGAGNALQEYIEGKR